MNWTLLIRVLRDEAKARRKISNHGDIRADMLEDLADAFEATLEVMREQELKETICGHHCGLVDGHCCDCNQYVK